MSLYVIYILLTIEPAIEPRGFRLRHFDKYSATNQTSKFQYYLMPSVAPERHQMPHVPPFLLH